MMGRRFTVGLLAVCLSCTILNGVRAEEKSDEDYFELMKAFADTFEQIDRNYVKDVDRRKLLEAAIRGMIDELDQYSSYIPPKNLRGFTEQVEQEFGGVGIQVQYDPQAKRLTVVSPLPGTPAYRAGVRSGDVIMEIEGKDAEGLTIEDAVKVLKGKPGEQVTIGVRHLGETETTKIPIVREIIRVSTVLGDHYEGDHPDFMLDDENKIGYVRLTAFSRHSAEELKDAIDELSKDGMKGLVLDLRNNPGGLLTQARDIANMFLKEGRIVSTKGRNSPERILDATAEGTLPEFPMAIIVNRYSASASEILSACLQDHERAVIVGERTWGKGSVQNVIELEGGSSALKLTTARYHRPSGKKIHREPGDTVKEEWGVTPKDANRLRLENEEFAKYVQFRRDRDVIKAEGPPESDFVDRQLELALNAVKTKLGIAVAEPAAEDKAAEGEKPMEKKEAAALPVPVRRRVA